MVELSPEDEQKLITLSPYQQAVLRLLTKVPKGKVTTYSDLAKELAKRNNAYSPKAPRAVGTAMRRNVCAPRIPCHRVIKSDGSIGNFRGGALGGVAEKIKLLQEEGIEVENGKVDLNRFRHDFS
ncbi:cysteine methyltransferase [Candidatus Heimdallarchaeota archaeon]|nr:MAG: cysteine methyltransferase [Candidatus Heimdallarchaeota archaeon]